MRSSILAACAFLALADAFAAEDEDWLAFPSKNGATLIHKDCVHHFDDNDFNVKVGHNGGDLLFQGQRQETLAPCPYAPRHQKSAHQAPPDKTKCALKCAAEAVVIWGACAATCLTSEDKDKCIEERCSAAQLAFEVACTSQCAKNTTNGLGESLRYYSDWVAYAFTTGDFGYMSSEWVVPKAPTSHGPVPGMSSTYLFNGLEDGGGVHGKSSYILQPVLSYGKSGCIINPIDFFHWYLISFSVTGSGRAYCGKRIAVKEGERVKGVMQLEEDGHTWSTISTRLSNNETSVASTDLGGRQPNAAYITLENMITYSCKAFPESGTITFESNVLKDRNGNRLKPQWKSLIRHTECNQQVKLNSDDSVTLTWDITKDMSQSDSVMV